ncbi:MAG: S1C family serine protease [Oscillospiraceae bacterium]
MVQYQYGSSSIEASGEGSGIIMTSDGYIITNAHVISGASGIKVVLNNGEEYEARVIGSDTRTDLAVIKIEANNLTPAEFGESSKMQEGDIVMAIGNPGGLTFAGSITQGILSGVNRQLSSSYGTTSVLQTDAAINPGNSGGALVNEYGQVIGINSSKISATDYEGIGFAIPIDDAKPIVDDLIQNGRVTGRVVLGVYNAQSVDEVASRVYGVPTGVLVGGTDPESDLAQKGVITGDIITKINNTDVTSTADIYTVLQDFEVGDSVKLTVFRRTSGQSDKTFEVTVTLMEDTGETTTQSQQQGSQRGQSQNESESGGWFSSFR